MIKVAFASNDFSRVNLHFGAAESFVIYDVSVGEADMIGIGRFRKVEMKGENRDKGLPRIIAEATADSMPEQPETASPDVPIEEVELAPDDKVIAKLDFLDGCAAVYAASIGASSIKRLMARRIQPIIVDNGHDIEDLLNEVSLALVYGGLSWVDQAKAAAPGLPQARWSEGRERSRRQLISSADELE
jgi:nitrogen fixation protein NifX